MMTSDKYASNPGIGCNHPQTHRTPQHRCRLHCCTNAHPHTNSRFKRLLWSGGGSGGRCFSSSHHVLLTCKTNRSNSSIVAQYKQWIKSMLLLLVLLNHSLLISGQCTIDQDCHPPIVSLYNSIDTPPGSPIPRSVTATQTCGVSGASPYRQHSGSNDPTEYQCTAGDTNAVFFLTDRTMVTVGDYTYNQLLLNTHWQSINTVTETTTGVFSDPTEVTIDVELTNPLLIRKIQLIFVNPQFDPDNTQLIIDMRPKAMAIERRVGELESFQLWRIFAEDCSTITAYGGMSIPVVTYTDENIVNVVGGTYEPTVPFCEQRYFSGDSATYTGWDLSSQQVCMNERLSVELLLLMG